MRMSSTEEIAYIPVSSVRTRMSEEPLPEPETAKNTCAHAFMPLAQPAFS